MLSIDRGLQIPHQPCYQQFLSAIFPTIQSHHMSLAVMSLISDSDSRHSFLGRLRAEGPELIRDMCLIGYVDT